MAFNWADQEIQQPKFTSMEDIFKGMQNVREMRRKRAIEDAIKTGVGPDGQFSGGRVRQSLTDAGFGEDADAVVRDIAMRRQGDVKSTAELGVALKGLVDNGIINESRARELFDNMTLREPIGTSTTSTVTTASTPAQSTSTGTGQIDETQLMQQAQSFVDEAPKSQPSGSPGSGTRQSVVGATEAIIRPEGELQPTGGVDSLTDIGPQTRTRRTEAQAVPDYASDLINWEKQEPDTSGERSRAPAISEYTLPTDADDLKNTKIALSRMGIAVDDKTTSEDIDAKLKLIAISEAGPAPIRAKATTIDGFMKADAEYNKAMKDYYSDIAKNFQSLIEKVNMGRGTKFTESQATEQLALARRKDAREAQAQGIAVSKWEAEKKRTRASENPELSSDVTSPDAAADAEKANRSYDEAKATYLQARNSGNVADLITLAGKLTKTIDERNKTLTNWGINLSPEQVLIAKNLEENRSSPTIFQQLSARLRESFTDNPTPNWAQIRNDVAEIARTAKSAKGFGRKYNDDFDELMRTQISGEKTAKDAMKDKGVGGGKTGTEQSAQDKSPRKPGESYSDYLRRTK